MVVIFGFVAFAVDIGYMKLARTQLQQWLVRLLSMALCTPRIRKLIYQETQGTTGGRWGEVS